MELMMVLNGKPLKGFFSAQLQLLLNAKLENEKHLVTYQGITYDQLEDFVSLFIRYPRLDEPKRYRYTAVWFNEQLLDLVKRKYNNLKEDTEFFGHIVTEKVNGPLSSKHKPFVKTDGTKIYYASTWCSDYIMDNTIDLSEEEELDIIKNGEMGDDGENYAVPAVKVDNETITIID